MEVEKPTTERVELKKPKHGELALATINGDYQQVNNLLKLGADVDENVGTEERPITPVMLAISFHKANIAELLIKVGGAKVNQDVLGYTLLQYAHSIFHENEGGSVNALLKLLGAPK
jgi:ankyrin repeat protein